MSDRTPVLLDLGCCPAGSRPGSAVDRAGGKAVVVVARTPPDPTAPEVDGGSGAAMDPTGWVGRVAQVVGLRPEVLAAGLPVPLAHHLLTWADVTRELDADRWDAVVVTVDPTEVGALLEAPDLLLRVLDARLAALAPTVVTDPVAASQVADLVAVRPDLLTARALAETACAAGHPDQHEGCGRPGGFGLATVDRDDPTCPSSAATGVREEGDGFVWHVVVPAGASPVLARDGGRVAVRAGDQRRTFRLPAALTRCDVGAARVVAGRLEVHLVPDPDAWR